MRGRRRETWAKWEALVEEQAGSGLSVAAFCRERGVPAWQLFAWKRRLRPAAVESFVEVQVEGSGARREPTRNRAIEIG